MPTLDNTSCLTKKSSLQIGRKERIRSSTHSPNASWRAKVFPLWKVGNCRVKRTGGKGSATWPEWITNGVREICIGRVSGCPRPRKCWMWENKWLVWNTFRWLESQDGPFWYLKSKKGKNREKSIVKFGYLLALLERLSVWQSMSRTHWNIVGSISWKWFGRAWHELHFDVSSHVEPCWRDGHGTEKISEKIKNIRKYICVILIRF